MNKPKRKLILIVVIIFLGTISLTRINKLSNIDKNNGRDNPPGSVIGTSNMYNLTGTPIYIDDLDPAYNWNETVKNEWCSGNGTETEPYILKNIIINGEGASDCITIKNSLKYFEIHNCTLYNGDDSGVYLNNVSNGYLFKNNCSIGSLYGIELNNSNYNRIEDNTANDIYSGIRLIQSNYSSILNNTLLRNYGHGVYIEESKNNTVRQNFAAYSTNGEGIYMKNSFYNKILNNEVKNNHYQNILFDYCDKNIIKNNFINKTDEIGYDGIYLRDSDENLILNNTSNFNRYGIKVAGNANIVCNNNFSNNRVSGIEIEGYDNSIVQNLVENTGPSSFYVGAIWSIYGGNNTIEKNEIINNLVSGITIEGSISNKIIKNRISNNTNGIYLIINVTKCLFSKNTIINNREHGISLDAYFEIRPNKFNTFIENLVQGNKKSGFLFDHSYNNSIIDNEIIGNSKNGTALLNADNNTFSRNVFINNSLNALDNGNGNLWSKDGMGNYWDEYRNYDYDKDGIGDVPHNISGTTLSKDVHPLGFFIPLIEVKLPFSNSNFSTNPPGYSILIDNKNVSSVWYTFDGGANNFTIGKYFGYLDQDAWENADEGPILLEFYALDIFGNIGTNESTIFKGIPKTLQINIKEELFTEEYFNITFQILNNQGEAVESSEVHMWWNETEVSADLNELENGTYFISLNPIIITSEEDPIPLRFLITHNEYPELISTVYIAVDPETVSKFEPKDKGDQELPLEIIIPIATIGSIGAALTSISIVYFFKKKK